MSYSVSLDSIGSKTEKERTLNVFFCQSRLYRMKKEKERNQSSDILQHSQNRPTGDRWLKL